jgi:putative transferase (TIGR04331 family)
LKSDAQPFYEKLREAGILFDSPEDAATAVDLVYDDVETWWNEPFRQEIINDFCRNFARTEKNFYILWLNEFERILEFSKKSKINK